MKNKHNSKSKSSGTKTQQNYNQSDFVKETKSFSSKSYGAKKEFPNAEQNSHENAWNRSRHSSVSDMWNDNEEHFPALGASAASMPKVNVWEERKSKQEAIKALEPQNQYDEEAMLQHALALSLLEATEEEERKKRLDENYQMQLEALQCSLEDLDAPDEFTMTRDSKSQFPDDESSEVKNESEFFSKNIASSKSEKKKGYSYRGARPKINKAIDAFGGWGLKEDRNKNYSSKASEFFDDVMSEKSAETSNISKTSNNWNKSKNIKENCISNEDGLWNYTDAENTQMLKIDQKSDNKNETLYNEKGAFIDDNEDGNWTDCKDETTHLPNVSSNEALDTWLSSEDINNWDSGELNEKEILTLDDQNTDNFIPPPSCSEKFNIEITKDENPLTSTAFSIPPVTNGHESKNDYESQILSKKTCESSKNVWSDADNYKKQTLSETENIYKANDLGTNNFSPFYEPTEVPTLTSGSIWSDKSSNNSTYFDLSNKLESVKLSNDVDNEVVSSTSSNTDSDLPPILHPQPPIAAPVSNENGISVPASPNPDCTVEPSPIPQPVSEMPIPQFAPMLNPVLNPMLPGFNPLLGCGMDPLLMRQMLILTNPFLANQLLAMEQYYRSMGLAVDLFSMPSTIPNVPGMINPLLQNPIANVMNGNVMSDMQQVQNPVIQAPVCKNVAENLEQNSFEKPSSASECDAAVNFGNSISPTENSSDDPWFKSYLCSDDAPIPPPKPPSNDVNCNETTVSLNSKASEIASSFDKFVNSSSSNNSTAHLIETKKERPLTAAEACVTKTDITGWGECDFDAQKLKNQSWDDGWGDYDDVPPKPLRNSSIHEEKKKVFRQPAKQPQISRYQRNFTPR